MLARTYGPKFNQYPCYVQPKLNGVRALYSNGAFQSRDEKIWRPEVLCHLQTQLASIPFLNRFILDGELYVHGWRLQRINGAVATNRSGPREDTGEIEYHVFDCIDPQNPNEPFNSRHLAMMFMHKRDKIKFVDTDYISTKADVAMYFDSYTSLGYEGIMLRPDGPYEQGITNHGTTYRSRYLWKYKKWQDSEFWCVGKTLGEGKASIGIGALVCQADNYTEPFPFTANRKVISTFNVGTGFTDEERIEYMQNPPIGKLIKVRYIGLSDSGIPLNPSFLCVM